MKKQLLTLSILSSAMNVNHVLADDIVKKNVDCKINIAGHSALLTLNCLQLTELTDKSLRDQLEKAVTNLVSASLIKSLENTNDEKAENLENALRILRGQIESVESQNPDQAIKVKSKILGELLRTGLVVIDRDETRRRDRVQLGFGPSIVNELEQRQGVLDVYARGGTICL